MKLYAILLFALLLFDCGKKRQPPPPPPQPSPIESPSPLPSISPSVSPSPVASPPAIPVARATPYPVPSYNVADYLPAPPSGRIVTVKGPDNLSEKLKAAQDDPTVGTVKIEGGGSFNTPVILRRHTQFDSSTYSCDQTAETGILIGMPVSDYGCFLVADNVLVEGTWRPPQEFIDYFKHGKGWDHNDPYLQKVQALTAEQLAGTGTTILEPTYVADWAPLPAVEVFQALGDSCCAHTDKAENITVRGFHIKGRQKVYDGGVRSTILFGNCKHCAAIENYLEDTASIGITFGGSAQEFRKQLPDGSIVTLKDNHASEFLAWHNITSGVAAANIAVVNGENGLVVENYVRRPGRLGFGGGVCGFDLETNSEADHSGVGVFNNLYDYEGGAMSGSAICLQDPFYGLNHKVSVAANNVAIGGRGEHSDNRFMTNGLFLNGLKQCVVVNNYVFRTGQNAIQAYGLDGCLIQDNDFESTGGGGNPTVALNGVLNTIFRRNNWRARPGLTINTQAGFIDSCGKGNVFEGNLTEGVVTGALSKPCP